MLAEGVLGGGRAPRVLAAVSEHAFVATAAATVVEQGRLAHGRGQLAAQYTAVKGRTRLRLKARLRHTIL